VYYVYILSCADGSFYVGSTQNLATRIKTHDDGRGAAHTFKNRPFRLVYSERFLSRTDASARERQLKRWSREKKAALISGNLERLKPQQAPLVELIFLCPPSELLGSCGSPRRRIGRFFQGVKVFSTDSKRIWNLVVGVGGD
jgi:putative endonuclease